MMSSISLSILSSKALTRRSRTNTCCASSRSKVSTASPARPSWLYTKVHISSISFFSKTSSDSINCTIMFFLFQNYQLPNHITCSNAWNCPYQGMVSPVPRHETHCTKGWYCPYQRVVREVPSREIPRTNAWYFFILPTFFRVQRNKGNIKAVWLLFERNVSNMLQNRYNTHKPAACNKNATCVALIRMQKTPAFTVRVCRLPDRKSLKKSGYIPVK